MITALVAVVSLVAVTAAGLVHRKSTTHRRATLALVIVVGALAVGSTVAAASIKWANCGCR